MLQKIRIRFSKLLFLMLLIGLAPTLSLAEQSVETRKGLLLLFLNPNGRPCQMQAQILKENITEIQKYVQIQGISTTVQAHRSHFYRFGVRQLPTLILIDTAGNVLHRFSPGIHQRDAILAEIRKLGSM
jgi:hypothetical protein